MTTQPQAKFKNLKPGDKVFVVYQRSTWQTRNDVPVKTEWAEVIKTGRTYGAIERYGRPAQFLLSNGQSWHGAHNGTARCNGQGFDVYASEQEYLDKEEDRRSRIRLAERLGIQAVTERSWINIAPIDLVLKFHAAIDDYEWANG